MSVKRATKRKKTELENQLRDGIISPPKLSESVKPMEGQLTFSVPSTMTDNLLYDVAIVTNDSGLNYICSCKDTFQSNNYETHNKNHNICKHIRATMIHMMLDLLKQQKDSQKCQELVEALNGFHL